MGSNRYKDAGGICRKIKSKLPLPKNEKEKDELMSIVKRLGVKRITVYKSIILDLVKTNGQWINWHPPYNPVSYTNWAKNQPGNRTKEQFASIAYGTDLWGSFQGYRIGTVICQQTLPTATSSTVKTHTPLEVALRNKRCTLKDPVYATISGRHYCFAYYGMKSFKQ